MAFSKDPIKLGILGKKFLSFSILSSSTSLHQKVKPKVQVEITKETQLIQHKWKEERKGEMKLLLYI